MSDSEASDDRHSEPQLDNWEAVARYAVTKVIDAIFSGKSPWLILAVLFLLGSFQIAYVYSLPKEERLGIESPIRETADAVNSILSSSPAAWLGWVLFGVAVLFFVPVTSILWRRVQSQGHRLKEKRDIAMSDRVSSRDEKSIDDYDEKMKQEFGDSDDTLNS